ncbi:MAG: MFS transporter [Acidobacteriales bacterium]|nr:MAG: MFS transporter [Terriglobales bacterium]
MRKVVMTHANNFSPVSLYRLMGFALGLFAVQTFWGFTWATLPLYLKELTGSNTVTGIIISMAGITGLFFPVIAGAVSDRIRTPLGRRRPLIITGWILACIMVGLLMRIDSLIAALPVIMLAYAGFFLAIGPYFALLPDTVPAAQRSFASGVMFLIGGTGMLSYLMFAARLWETSHTRPFVWVVIAVAVSVTVMCFSVREAKVPVRLKQPNLLREVLRRKNVLKFFAAMTLQWIGLWMLSAFFVIANMALFGLSVERAIKAFFVMNVSFVLFALPAGLLANKLGLKRTTISGMAIMIVSFCCVSFVKSYTALIVLMVISGIGYGTVLAVSYPFFLSLLPEGNTAGFVGFYHACQNGTLLIGPVVGGFMVDHFGYTTLFYGAAAVMLAGLITYTIVRNPEGRVRN